MTLLKNIPYYGSCFRLSAHHIWDYHGLVHELRLIIFACYGLMLKPYALKYDIYRLSDALASSFREPAASNFSVTSILLNFPIHNMQDHVLIISTINWRFPDNFLIIKIKHARYFEQMKFTKSSHKNIISLLYSSVISNHGCLVEITIGDIPLPMLITIVWQPPVGCIKPFGVGEDTIVEKGQILNLR